MASIRSRAALGDIPAAHPTAAGRKCLARATVFTSAQVSLRSTRSRRTGIPRTATGRRRGSATEPSCRTAACGGTPCPDCNNAAMVSRNGDRILAVHGVHQKRRLRGANSQGAREGDCHALRLAWRSGRGERPLLQADVGGAPPRFPRAGRHALAADSGSSSVAAVAPGSCRPEVLRLLPGARSPKAQWGTAPAIPASPCSAGAVRLSGLWQSHQPLRCLRRAACLSAAGRTSRRWQRTVFSVTPRARAIWACVIPRSVRVRTRQRLAEPARGVQGR